MCRKTIGGGSSTILILSSKFSPVTMNCASGNPTPRRPYIEDGRLATDSHDVPPFFTKVSTVDVLDPPATI